MDSRSRLPAVDDGGEARSIFAQCQRPLTLKFEEVIYKIKTKENKERRSQGGGGGGAGLKKMQPRHADRRILKGVSGCVLPGEMLAMLGPSGSGKTTLLTALGGRIAQSRHLSGSITYNGRPFSNSLKRCMGFVTQDDILYPHLTVAETLLYTALLRLPRSLSRQEKAAHVEAVMAQLGLTVCSNSIIGGSLVRGVSGGESKRVSIGQEILINPSLLFLDEPTSGLDSTTAQRIVSTLWELTSAGRTVVLTIHQPSCSLFYMFHKILLLSDGNPVYFGMGSEAMDYFDSISYAPSIPMNPADFLLDLANGVSPDGVQENRAAIKETLVSAYGNHLQNKIKEELREIGERFKEIERDRRMCQWNTAWWEQFTVLQRGLKERKHESFSGLKIAQVLVVALLSGLLWWRSGGRVQDQVFVLQ